MMKVPKRLAIVAVSCAMSFAAQGQATKLTPDEFRSRFNLVCRDNGLTLRLGEWKPEPPGSPDLAANVNATIHLIAERDREGRLSSLLLLMQSRGTLESVAGIVATLAATTYAVNPELSDADREALFEELGFHQEDWGARGLDGIAVRNGVTYRAILPGGDALIVALVSWDAAPSPSSRLSLKRRQTGGPP
ncbi:MAG: hypothetical protein ACXWLR_02000 [Myxococcales bacterium]